MLIVIFLAFERLISITLTNKMEKVGIQFEFPLCSKS